MTSKAPKIPALFLTYRKGAAGGVRLPWTRIPAGSMQQAEPIGRVGPNPSRPFRLTPHTVVDSGDLSSTIRMTWCDTECALTCMSCSAWIPSQFGKRRVRNSRGRKTTGLRLEVASISTRRRDMARKECCMPEIGIGEYWRYDPTGGEHRVRAGGGSVGGRLISARRAGEEEDGCSGRTVRRWTCVSVPGATAYSTTTAIPANI